MDSSTSLAANALEDGLPRGRVLIVDDDPSHRALERAILEDSGFEVIQASSGMEAIDRLRAYDIDAVLLDKRMPGIDGNALCRMIRSDLGMSMLSILMVTGEGDINHLTQSLAAGANDFIRKPYDPEELVARVGSAVSRKRVCDQLENAESMLFALARMVEAKDGNTGDHCTRLAQLGVLLGRELGLDAADLLALRRGGVLHDIGKLGIPDSVLLKPGKLDEREWRIMRQHVEIGTRLIGGLKSMSRTIPIIRHHHERWDGTGYPDGLSRQRIPLLARVFQTVDIYDALAHSRPYKTALPLPQIVQIMREEVAKGWRDPEVTAVFLDVLENRPEQLEILPENGRDLGQGIYASIVDLSGEMEMDT